MRFAPASGQPGRQREARQPKGRSIFTYPACCWPDPGLKPVCARVRSQLPSGSQDSAGSWLPHRVRAAWTASSLSFTAALKFPWLV